MAVQARASKLHFLVVLLTISSSCLRVQCIQEFIGACGLTIDLFQAQIVNSGILKMTLPDSMDAYQDPSRQRYCDIIINFASGQNLMIELYFLDIMPKTGDITTCSTGLRIFDQNDRQYYGSILCMQGWQWEERHREKQNEKLLVPNSPLTVRLVSNAPYTGEGFKMHFNQIRPTWPCVLREFRCRQVQYCVNDDLTCDGWDDCGDYSDERIEAGCDLLTASEICALIIGILLLLGSVVAVFIYCITCRRLSRDYGMRSESKVPIVVSNYNVEPSLGASRGYYSQESIPSKYSRSTGFRRDSDGDTIDKADLEKADKQEMEPLTGIRNSNRDNMSERSIRSNPRRLVAQAATLGTEAAPPEVIKKSGSYSYGGRRGRAASQNSLNRSKGELANDKEDGVIRNNLENELVESTEKLSVKDRSGRYRDRDRYSDSDDYYDDDRKRRSSRERDRRRSGRYSDEDSDFDRDRDYRRRRRRSYDRYSDEDSDYDRDRDYRRRRRRSYDRYSDEDSDFERERRSRRSKDRYSREKLNDQDNGIVEGDGEKDSKRPSKRQDSKERDRSRERYIRDRLDDEDSDRGRRLDKERSYRRESRERDKDRYRDDDDDSDRGRRLDKERSYYRRESRERDRDRDDDDDRPVRRRSIEKRRGTSADRDRLSGDLSKNENRRSRSRENIQSRDRGRNSPPLPAPPPYTEEDTKPYLQKQSSTFVEQKRFTQSQSLPPPPADLPEIEMSYISSSESRVKKVTSSEIRYREQQIPKTPPLEDKIRETLNEKLSSSEDKFRKQKHEKLSSSDDKIREPQKEKLSTSTTKYREQQKLSATDVRHQEQPSPNSSLSEVKFRESQTQKLSSVDVKYREPQKTPASNDVYKEKQIQKPPPSEVRYREPFKLRTLEVDLKESDQDGQKLPPKEVNDVDRRRHTDDRRERYSRARWTPKKKELDSPPPEYEDVAPKSVYVSAAYREESV